LPLFPLANFLPKNTLPEHLQLSPSAAAQIVCVFSPLSVFHLSSTKTSLNTQTVSPVVPPALDLKQPAATDSFDRVSMLRLLSPQIAATATAHSDLVLITAASVHLPDSTFVYAVDLPAPAARVVVVVEEASAGVVVDVVDFTYCVVVTLIVLLFVVNF